MSSEVLDMRKPDPSLPYAVPQGAHRVIWLIKNTPPPTPLCFDSKEQWQEQLLLMHASGETITRRQDTAKWTTVDGKKVRTQRTVTMVFDRIDYCADCDIGSQTQIRKRQAGRCIMPPLPYKTQLHLFDASTDTLAQQRDKVASEAMKRKMAGRLEKAAAFLRAHGFGITAPSRLDWIGAGL